LPLATNLHRLQSIPGSYVAGAVGKPAGWPESRVLGIGPQIGYLIPVGDKQGYLNLKGYEECEQADLLDLTRR
jgi:hypothetical protein